MLLQICGVAVFWVIVQKAAVIASAPVKSLPLLELIFFPTNALP